MTTTCYSKSYKNQPSSGTSQYDYLSSTRITTHKEESTARKDQNTDYSSKTAKLEVTLKNIRNGYHHLPFYRNQIQVTPKVHQSHQDPQGLKEAPTVFLELLFSHLFTNEPQESTQPDPHFLAPPSQDRLQTQPPNQRRRNRTSQ